MIVSNSIPKPEVHPIIELRALPDIIWGKITTSIEMTSGGIVITISDERLQ